jgi:hypothetical protein
MGAGRADCALLREDEEPTAESGGAAQGAACVGRSAAAGGGGSEEVEACSGPEGGCTRPGASSPTGGATSAGITKGASAAPPIPTPTPAPAPTADPDRLRPPPLRTVRLALGFHCQGARVCVRVGPFGLRGKLRCAGQCAATSSPYLPRLDVEVGHGRGTVRLVHGPADAHTDTRDASSPSAGAQRVR